MVEAQPVSVPSTASLGPHYYFGHRHFNYTAPHASYTAPASSLYDLEWTAPSPSSRTPTAASSSSPAALSPPSSEHTAAVSRSPCGGTAAASPYSRSLGSWDAGAVGTALGSSTDAAAISPVLLYHSPLLGASESDCEVAAVAAAAVAAAHPGAASPHHHHSQPPYHSYPYFHYGPTAPLHHQPQPATHSHYHHPQQQQQQQEQHVAPSLDMSRRRGRKRRCDEAIMAPHPSALMTVKVEAGEEEQEGNTNNNNSDDDDGGSTPARATGLLWPFGDSEHPQQQRQQESVAIGSRPSNSAVKSERASGSETEDDECDDDFFSDDIDEDEECDEGGGGDEDDDDDDAVVGQRRGGRRGGANNSNGGPRRRRKVVKVERKVQKVQVTEDLNIEAHLSPESDGYRWRKYGRKTVKGSPYPRSYFKCTYPHCLVKKQVEAVIKDGHIVSTSSIYKGKHSHDRPCVTQLTAHDQDSFRSAVITGFSKYAHAAAGTISPNNTPRLVVTTQSNVDYLDDGYRWRKYGQKYVKGSGYPRSYYKCTDKLCPVKKQVDSLVSGMVVTYEGAHTHAPCLDKSSPRKRRRRTPSAAAAAAGAAPAATRTRRGCTPADNDEDEEHNNSGSHYVPGVKLEREDDLRSDEAAPESTPAMELVDEQLPPLHLSYDVGAPQHYNAAYAPAVHRHHYHQHQHQPSHGDVPAYRGPSSFPLEMKKERLDEDDAGQQYHHYHHHHQQHFQPRHASRPVVGSDELCSFEDLHGEMIDFLMWEESGHGHRFGHPLPLHHHHHHHRPQQATHYPQHQMEASSPTIHGLYPSSSSIPAASSYYTASLSSPLSAPSSSTSSFSSSLAPLDCDYSLGSSFSN
jgi:hypothetical protein